MESPKKVLLVGLFLKTVPSPEKLAATNVDIAVAATINEVREKCNEQKFDIAIIGAGIDLPSRLSIVEELISTNDGITVHLKDRKSGPEGFLPFINALLKSLAT